jgi:hypothetical protein
VRKRGRTPFATCLPRHRHRQDGVRFHILAEHLVGIEVRAAGRQEDQPDLGRVFVDPLSCLPGAVDRMSIHDQEALSIGLRGLARRRAESCGGIALPLRFPGTVREPLGSYGVLHPALVLPMHE